jgi:hypothetical protein
MRLSFGKFNGFLLERILLTEPSYTFWLLNVEKPDRYLKTLRNTIHRLIGIFDQKPILKKCQECGQPATRLSITARGYELLYWCDDCRPRSLEYYGEKLDVVQSLMSALCLEIRSPKGYFESNTPLLALAYSKGLPNPLTDRALEAFFLGIFGSFFMR